MLRYVAKAALVGRQMQYRATLYHNVTLSWLFESQKQMQQRTLASSRGSQKGVTAIGLDL